MTLIKLKAKEGDPQSVVNQLRALMLHFNRLVEDEGLVKRFWGHVRHSREEQGGRGGTKTYLKLERRGYCVVH